MDQTPQEQRLSDLDAAFAAAFGAPPHIVTRAPGRVNLIGEHTDYNDGFVFPAAIQREVIVGVSARQDGTVRALSLNFHQESAFDLIDVQPATENRERWSNYLRAMASTLKGEGVPVCGMNCAVVGDVPLGAGLSSSAAILVASGLAFAAAAGQEMEPVRLALLAQKAEREFVGVNVGIMDQFISALGQPSHALLIDTRALTYEAVPLPETGVSLVIADTNKRRGLVDSEYNTRRTECERAVELLRQRLPAIRALRDVSLEQLEKLEGLLPEVVRKRARHVVTEDARTLDSAMALKAGDVARFGALMDLSHESLRVDYQVSSKELDAMVDAARSVDGVFGARMTGAGFGGCAIALVADEALGSFEREAPARYRAATGLDATLYVTTAANGASRLR